MTKKQESINELAKAFSQLSPEDRLKAIQANIQQQNIAAATLAKTARATSEFETNYANDELDFSLVPVGDVRKRLKASQLAASQTMKSVQVVQTALEGGAV